LAGFLSYFYINKDIFMKTTPFVFSFLAFFTINMVSAQSSGRGGGTTTSTSQPTGTTSTTTTTTGGRGSTTGTTSTTGSTNTTSGSGVVGGIVNTITGQGAGLSNQTIVNGLKEALNVSAKNSVDFTSKTDGFFKNPEIFIPFPKEAQSVKTLADKYGLKSQTDNFVKQLNRAAETAAKEATPIFINAITSITITDGVQLLQGGDNAATTFLQNKTRQPLHDKFSPVVKKALDKVQISKYWTPLWSNYNKYAPAANSIGSVFGQGNVLPKAVNPDLNEYVTNLALDGLFKIMAKEEAKIRKDPAARVNDILTTVFG
jgi:hypothetical protein